ncbi:beta-propeller domain-containing protein [Actinoplanes sp. NPDC049316]|uniref:beta-propeller domain-containing protein n=1 Tax=Actinoplanes sp. NPDC049316 TaxID=3154727 RepID=UPI003447E361
MVAWRPTPMSRRSLLCITLAVAIPLAGCTSGRGPEPLPPPAPPASGAMRLVAFDSCERLAADLKQAAKASVGPYGFPGSAPVPEAVSVGGARTMADSAGAAADSGGAAAPAHSSTNNHEQDADEPDIVKTDGRRIVTVQHGTLRVIDAATRRLTGKLNLGLPLAGDQLDLLLSGNVALVLASGGMGRYIADKGAPAPVGPQVLSVDLSGPPRIISRYKGEGTLVDARLTGSTARVVLRTAPRITFPLSSGAADDADRVAANRKTIDGASADAWLPTWEVTTDGTTSKGTVDCGRVSRPTDYSAASMVSILTFDLTRPALGSGDPVTVVADGDTVYATGESLYLAADQRWRLDWFKGRAAAPVRQETDLYRFTTAGNQPPTYAAAGHVPGFLINQYALSEWNGHLRVATTDETKGQSAVRVLRQDGDKLVQTGEVDGLGKGERIYSVRFIGPRGYVVTFRQTDPLYSVDLSDPSHPRVTGELKITGYSAHLQPAGENRLIGVGQEADGNGRVQGTQISLFDVTDPAHPARLAQHQIPAGQSEAEYDPHALLWWPATNLLVVPVTAWPTFDRGLPTGGAVALRVTATGIEQIGMIDQGTVRRSLVVGDVLWTLSDDGIRASRLSTMERVAWLPNV